MENSTLYGKAYIATRMHIFTYKQNKNGKIFLEISRKLKQTTLYIQKKRLFKMLTSTIYSNIIEIGFIDKFTKILISFFFMSIEVMKHFNTLLNFDESDSWYPSKCFPRRKCFYAFTMYYKHFAENTRFSTEEVESVRDYLFKLFKILTNFSLTLSW